jgi:pantoate--beta-alanine ligase
MIEARTIAAMRAARDAVSTQATVGFVPTMGALHAGHVELLRRARDESDVVVASVFVNPTQFAPGEDLDRYPRDEEADRRILAETGVDVVFLPTADEVYPHGFRTWVEVAELSSSLEGDARPGHFRGVATVCLKLFNIVQPSRVYFGQKDAQQAAVIERMMRDLALPVELRVVPTVRDSDGLALSSRNAYLSEAERRAAGAIPIALRAGEEAHREGGDAIAAARAAIEREPRLEPEYVELARFDGRLFLVVAARVGTTRLIDNVVLEGAR